MNNYRIVCAYKYTEGNSSLSKFTFLIVLLSIMTFSSCQYDRSSDEVGMPDHVDIIPGLASPITSDLDVTVIDIYDYLTPDISVDSVTVAGRTQEFNGAEVHIHEWPISKAMTSLDIWSGGIRSSIPMKRTKMKKVTFRFDPQGKEFSSIKLKGEMTAWNPDVLIFQDVNGIYETEMILEPRDYQYIMLLDGKEITDINNPDSIDNGFGGFNSVLRSFGSNVNELHIDASLENSELRFTANDPNSDFLVLWEDQKLSPVLDGESVVVSIPSQASSIRRSHIRVWAFDEERISNDLLIPLEEGHPFVDAQELERSDKHAMSLYNVFVDRFLNGDEGNDRPVNSDEVLPIADDMGGDIRGAIDKLEQGYFKELGINTIWISPIVKNVEGAFGSWPDPKTRFSAYHGYWPISFTLIDDRKGTPAELHELVDKAHSNGMNVLLDFVANHVHEQHPFYQSDTTIATDLYLPDGSLNTERWDDHRLTTWFDVFLPTLRLDDPRVYETLTDSALYWIQEYELDGFRHDATKHVPEIFWKTLTRKLKKGPVRDGKDIYQIGETYGSAELISSYVNSGQLDAQFDFNLYDALVASLCRREIGFDRLDDEMKKSLNTYGHHHLMGNITGNQDRGRFISYAGGALKFDENAKVAGWTREVGVGDEVAYARSQQLMAIISTIPGLPVVYYGDEIGSYGGNDPDNRKMMRFDRLSDLESSLKKTTAELLNFRRSSMPLMYGDFRTQRVEDDVYIYSRTYLGSSVYIAINSSDKKKEVSFEIAVGQSLPDNSLDGDFDSDIQDRTLNMKLEPNSYKILY